MFGRIDKSIMPMDCVLDQRQSISNSLESLKENYNALVEQERFYRDEIENQEKLLEQYDNWLEQHSNKLENTQQVC